MNEKKRMKVHEDKETMVYMHIIKPKSYIFSSKQSSSIAMI